LDGDADVAVLALRTSSRLGVVELGAAPIASPMFVASGPAASADDGSPERTGRLLAQPQEVLWVPAAEEFLGVAAPEFRWPGLEPGEGCADLETHGSLLLRIDPSGRTVTDVFSLPGLCVVGAAAWDPHGRRVLLGWQDEAVLHSFDPVTRDSALHRPWEDEDAGDVSEIAVHPVKSADRMYSAARLSSTLTELRLSDLRALRSVDLGGVLQDIVVDAERDRLYVAGFYSSRVWIVDTASLEPIGSLPTGLGTSAIALDADRGLLLAASVFDGTLRAWDVRTDELVAALPVGGPIDDIAIDPRRGDALLMSRCGLLRADLDALQGDGS
jgi:hypothetical protein